jgi:hypothetical protein
VRIRSVKPGFWSSERVAALPSDTHRLVFIGLWNYVDDHGRGLDNALLVRAALFPLEDRAAAAVEVVLTDLAAAGLVCRYEAGGKRLLHVCGFKEHQRVNRPYPSQLPEPPDHGAFSECAVSDHGAGYQQVEGCVERSVTDREKEMDTERDAARERVVRDIEAARAARRVQG